MDYSKLTVKQVIKKTRHKAEIPLWIIAYAVTIIIYLVAAAFCLGINNDASFYQELLASTDNDEISIAILNVIKVIGAGAIIIIILALAIYIAFNLYKMYAQEMAYAVKVSEVNFPEIYNKAKEFSDKLGFKKVPEIYVTQENGSLNAFASNVVFRQYIQLNAEMVDIAYMENKDFDAIYFIMGHEFGHLYFKHTSIRNIVFTIFFKMVPFFGNLLTRAMEYSCDRVAQALTDDKQSAQSLIICAAGRHLYKHVDMNEYINNALGNYGPLQRLARLLLNLTKSHPIMPFRIKALMDPDRKSGRLI